MDKQVVLEKIKALIEKYQDAVKDGRASKYNEEMTKKDFILPLFDALGWKTSDSREVSAEEQVSKKRVDYGFRINGIPKFFLEAKSLKEDLDNTKFFEQAVSYAWHKGCTWAVLTNFVRVKILNAEWKANNYLQSHFSTLDYGDFEKKFDDLMLLSKEEFGLGKLDEIAERYGKKTKRMPIDKQLLTDFTHFRDILSRSITKLNMNSNLSEEELDESVQRVLDRLIFIRSCEDRELNPKILISNYREWESKGRGHLIKSLRDTFAHFDDEYNSKLFANHLCDKLDIDNEVLHEVIEGLYHTKDRESYDFAIIDADILGVMYEQYLSHILKKTERRAKLTDSQIHRRERGIYYTPPYIVDYMMRRTLGEKLKNKRLDVETVRFLDPACGSGSFLIKAFDLLNEYHKENDEDYKQAQLDLKLGLPFKTKTRILKNNIFGVDLDKKAVEIAQLNLLLKITEKGHRLPLLEQNIKKGDSLIDDETLAESTAFLWEDKFRDILGQGGFDVVGGNPPYINAIQLSKTVSKEVREYWSQKYSSAKGAYDIFILFFEQSLKVCKEGGFVCFITPNKYLCAPYAVALRELISKNYKVIKILDLSEVKVFNDPSVYPVITIIQKTKPNKPYKIFTERIHSDDINDKETFEISSRNLTLLPDYNWGTVLSENVNLIEKIIDKSKPLNPEVATAQATSTASEADEYSQYINESDKGLYFINTGTIDRYRTTHGLTKINNSGKKIARPFLDISKVSDNRRRMYTSPKIIISKLALRIEGFLDTKGEYSSTNTNCIHTPKQGYSLKYLAGVINSNLMSFVYSELFSGLRMSGGYFQFQAPQLRVLPIAEASEAAQRKISVLVDKMMILNERLNRIGDKKTDERTLIEKQISKLDLEIDGMIYKIYGITDAEKKIIESSLRQRASKPKTNSR